MPKSKPLSSKNNKLKKKKKSIKPNFKNLKKGGTFKIKKQFGKRKSSKKKDRKYIAKPKLNQRQKVNGLNKPIKSPNVKDFVNYIKNKKKNITN